MSKNVTLQQLKHRLPHVDLDVCVAYFGSNNTTVVTLMLVGLLINPKNGDPFKNNKQLR